MDAEMLALTEEALSHLTPEYEYLFRSHFDASQLAYEALADNPIRDRFDAEERDIYFGDQPEIDEALAQLDDAVAQPLYHILFLWMMLIGPLEEARATAYELRRRQVRQLMPTLTITDPAALPLNPDGNALECVVCNDELILAESTLIQLPCHPTHVFHQQCIQPWLERSPGCPHCRAVVELPPLADPPA
ncbi:zinc ion binding [Puccinia graminis f. sp. tritici]|uniref:Zinc ion binding n=1 Tax=Puccinia graminis f. sp. tritici TaxID=56615 RepID=A0A5B0QRZ2_PUCGR|nr:zinc ion binding [Puccinia graminis f. sp. tritici]